MKKILIVDNQIGADMPDLGAYSDVVDVHTDYPQIGNSDFGNYAAIFIHRGNKAERDWLFDTLLPNTDRFCFSGEYDLTRELDGVMLMPRSIFYRYVEDFITQYLVAGRTDKELFKG